MGGQKGRCAHAKGGLVGDVRFHEVVDVAGWLTPVPGGVGPMTIATLLSNTLIAADLATIVDDGRNLDGRDVGVA